ncbi:hypothetical protein TMatcc_009892, partial [Talaromyces marneffei ATCC 18224]
QTKNYRLDCAHHLHSPLFCRTLRGLVHHNYTLSSQTPLLFKQDSLLDNLQYSSYCDFDLAVILVLILTLSIEDTQSLADSPLRHYLILRNPSHS